MESPHTASMILLQILILHLELTTFVLENPCAGMNASDELQIVVEEDFITTRPFDFGTDRN